jgi:hypothetical protein
MNDSNISIIQIWIITKTYSILSDVFRCFSDAHICSIAFERIHAGGDSWYCACISTTNDVTPCYIINVYNIIHSRLNNPSILSRSVKNRGYFTWKSHILLQHSGYDDSRRSSVTSDQSSTIRHGNAA